MLPYVFMCGVCMCPRLCGCITCVGVKKCYISTSCCLSLLIDAQQRCRMALAWATFHRSAEKTSAADIFKSRRNVPVSTLFAPFDPILQSPPPPNRPNTFDMPNFTLFIPSSSPLPSANLAQLLGFTSLFGCRPALGVYAS